uniref:GG11923 n=1 Tax=Drosophila erecta TaxID=7220 RepID=B3P246_DROER
MVMSPHTLHLLMGEIPADVEEMIRDLPEGWDPFAHASHPPTEPMDTDDAVISSHPLLESAWYLEGWGSNVPHGRLPGKVWQAIEERRPAAQRSRQRFRIMTEEGSNQVAMKPRGGEAVRFVPGSQEGM